MINNTALFGISAILLLVLLSSLFSPPFVTTTMAQQQQQMMTTTPPSLLSPPLTPEEQEEQNRLQSVIASTTANLNETEKQVSGIVYTPRWSEPVWINANSLSVLIAYCLPGEFADSGQEILGGFELEVLESYAVALPQGFMAWMAVVGNQDEENIRLPAAVGVICASDLNDADTRILSPQEQQEINNINQQFSTIQNTQITNIDQVINIINNVTGTPQNETGGVTEQPLTVEIIPNATEAFATSLNPATIAFDSKVTGGAPPYSYTWRHAEGGEPYGYQRSLVLGFEFGPTHTIILDVTDSKNQTASDSVQILITSTEVPPLRAEIIPNATSGFTLDRFELKTNVRGGGTEPYTYSWYFVGDFQNFAAACNVLDDPTAVPDLSCMVFDTNQAGTHEVRLYIYDNMGETAASDSVQITVRERLPGGAVAPEPGAVAPSQIEGPPIVPEEGETGGPIEEQPGVPPPPPQVPEGEGEDSAPTPPGDDTEGEQEGGGTPPSTTEEGEELPTPPGDDTGEGQEGET
jgi:hypothetical protein